MDFPNICPIVKPKFIPSTDRLNGHWIAGFTQADGSFGLNIYKTAGLKLGYSARPVLRLVQHERDLLLLERILAYWSCGKIYVKNIGWKPIFYTGFKFIRFSY